VAVLRRRLSSVVSGDDLGAALAFLQRDRLDALAAHFLQEVGIADLVARRRAPVELLEHGEQHQGDHQPDSDFGKPLIVHRGSFLQIQRGCARGDAPDSNGMGSILVQSRVARIARTPREKCHAVFRPERGSSRL
jgi:hypothetical protein